MEPLGAIGVRELTVLGEFKPFGLVAEELEENPPEGDAAEEYHYFLFDPEITRERIPRPFGESSLPSTPASGGYHEIFIRGNRLTWSMGSSIHKRYSCPSKILMACWCRMDATSEAFICVLQEERLSIFSPSGEAVSVPLTHVISSIWPLPFGLVLQKSADNTPITLPSSSSCSLRNARDLSWQSRDHVPSHHMSLLPISHGLGHKEDSHAGSSHLILTHPLQEPQAIFSEERGKLSPMKDSNEIIVWTSDIIPLLATYHKVKLKHSIWTVEVAPPICEVISSYKGTDVLLQKQYSLRRIWQGKCSQFSANKVFLATDDDAVPIICFLLQEQKNLLSIRLEINELNVEASFDVKPELSWVIPAVNAFPLTVTHSRVKLGVLPFNDILVLASDGSLLLHRGKQCLCKYVLPTALERISALQHTAMFGKPSKFSNTRVVELADAVREQINLVLCDGKMLRCTLRRSPPSSLVDDCINVMSFGLHPSFYNLFCVRFWGDNVSQNLFHAGSHVDCEWDLFVEVITRICHQYKPIEKIYRESSSATSWDYLLNSEFHAAYHRHSVISHLPVNPVAFDDGDLSSTCGEGCPDNLFCSQFLMETLESLHALYESLKLDTLRKFDLEQLACLLCKVASSLGETNYMDHYIRNFPYISAGVRNQHFSKHPRDPPCIFRWLENCLKCGYQSSDVMNLPPLILKERIPVLSWAQKIVSFYSLLLGAEHKHNHIPLGILCDSVTGTTSTVEESTVLAMVAEGFGLQQVDLLPTGIALPLRHVLDTCRDCPPADWPAPAYVLIGREDLALARLRSLDHIKEKPPQAIKSLTSSSTPYKLHLQPVTVPPSISEIENRDIVKVGDSDSSCNYLVDGMEHILNSSAQLHYGCDLRLNEVRRLLCSARPVSVQTNANPNTADQDVQQHQLWNLAQRTCALPLGRGAFTLATSYALLTEALVVPKLVLAGQLPAQQNATVNIDANLRNISELRSWPDFHNGVAAGLKLAPFVGKISKSWIRYNRPDEPNDAHAGILLALGLHGYLHVFVITDAFGYLQPQHETSTVGILLGMGASHRGTMNPAISKMLYLHIPSRFPPSFPELDLPTLMQSAALMALGLLYEGSAHPLTMKMLAGEIGRRSGGDNVPEREGYALAAGAALGLVALGRGLDPSGFSNSLVDRLYQYVGGRDVSSDRYFKVGQVIDEQNRGTGQVMDGTHINVDVTAPGATVALALIYLKTEAEEVATMLSIPTTCFELQYVRPDFLMLRIIARNLIMWSRICPSRGWVEAQVPEVIKTGLARHDDNTYESGNIDSVTLVQAYVNILTGACICIGLRYAGTRNAEAHELLYNYAIYILNEIKPVCGTSSDFLARGLFQDVDRATLEQCLHLIVLSLSVVMAGSGHLKTFRLLRYLRNRSSAEGHISYGIQMAVSLAIGLLFLGGGTQTFSTRNSAVAALLITLYPRLPSGPNDNRCHLQAFRHFYVIAAESRWLQAVDVDTSLPVYAPLEITILGSQQYAETSFCEITPCNLPERALLKTVRICGPRYWSQVIELIPEDKSWWKSGDKMDPFHGGIIYVKRKVGACSYVDDPVGCQSLLSRAMHKVTGAFGSSVTKVGNVDESSMSKIDQLVSAFSADPSLISFARLCCDSWENIVDTNFQEFCSQVLFECVSKDRPMLLQVYLSLYASIGLMGEQVQHFHSSLHDSLFLSNLKVAVAYKDAVLSGRFKSGGRGIIQTVFIESLQKRVEEILQYSAKLRTVFRSYLETGRWPESGDKGGALLLSWYLQWYEIPSSHTVKTAVKRLRDRGNISSTLPFLHMLLPRTHVKALAEIDSLRF